MNSYLRCVSWTDARLLWGERCKWIVANLEVHPVVLYSSSCRTQGERALDTGQMKFGAGDSPNHRGH